MRQSFTQVVIHFLLSFFIIGESQSQSIEARIDSLAEAHNMIGLVCLVTCGNNEVLVHHAYGNRQLNPNLEMNLDTRFRIASVSKTVTAIGLMKLWEDDLFDLDDDVSDALGFDLRNPSYPDSPITYRQLLSHTSSIIDGNGYGDFLEATYGSENPPAIEELLTSSGAFYSSDMFNTIEPGTYFNYSNINYGIIATLIESLTNRRFDEYMKDEILNPLGIEGSYNLEDIEPISNLAALYRNSIPQADHFQGITPNTPVLEGYIPGQNGLVFSPQGGLRVSARELSRIMLMLYNDGTLSALIEGEYQFYELLEHNTTELMELPVYEYNGSNGNNYFNLFNSWGLGLHITTNTSNGDIIFPDTQMYGHPGEAYGLVSDMYYEPLGQGIVLLTNGYYGSDGYAFGDNSAYYSIEESLFELIDEEFDCVYYGVDENAQGLIISPNPSNRKFVIEIQKEINLIEIIDLSGRTVPFICNRNEIILTENAEGMYLIRVHSGNDIYIEKIIVK